MTPVQQGEEPSTFAYVQVSTEPKSGIWHSGKTLDGIHSDNRDPTEVGKVSGA